MGAKIMRVLREALFALILCAATAVSLTAAAQPAAAPRASSAPATPAVAPPVVPAQGAAPGGGQGDTAAAEYVIGPEDTIEIEVIGQPNRARARVYTDGSVQLDLIGRIPAAGLCASYLARREGRASPLSVSRFPSPLWGGIKGGGKEPSRSPAFSN